MAGLGTKRVAKKKTNGGTTAPVVGSPISKASGRVGSAVSGMERLPKGLPRKPPLKAAQTISARKGKNQSPFMRNFENASPSERHKLVKKKLGGQDGNWRKKVYGKNYKPGTVGKINTQVKKVRSNEKQFNTKLHQVEKSLKSSKDAPLAQKGAIENRRNELKAKLSNASSNLVDRKKSRDKFLDLRDKALEKVSTGHSKKSPAVKETHLKKTVKARLENGHKFPKPKKKKKPTWAPYKNNGGTTAK